MFKKYFRLTILLAIVFSLFVSIFSLFSASYWADSLANYRLQFLYLSLILLILSFFTKSKWAIFLGIFLMILNSFETVSYYWPTNPTTHNIPKITLFSLNVGLKNHQFDKIGQAIATSQADLVLLMDVNAECLQKLNPYLKNYPHQITQPDEDVGGMAVFSKIPADYKALDFLKSPPRKSILTKMKIGSDSLHILAIHPKASNTSLKFQQRNRELRSIAQAKNNFQQNLIVIGDFNTTPYSAYYQDFKGNMQLKDSQIGRGIQNSSFKANGWLGFSLDHCLHSSNIQTIERKLGQEVGAEHLPLIVRLAW